MGGLVGMSPYTLFSCTESLGKHALQFGQNPLLGSIILTAPYCSLLARQHPCQQIFHSETPPFHKENTTYHKGAG